LIKSGSNINKNVSLQWVWHEAAGIHLFQGTLQYALPPPAEDLQTIQRG